MAWARVCASCCWQLAEAVLFTPTGVGAEERTPLLSSSSANQFPGPLILRGPGTPNAGFSCSPNGFTSNHCLSGRHKEVGLSTDSSSFWGPGATGASWPTAVLLADLEQDSRQGECALAGAAPAGLAPLKPEASQSSSPGPTSCIRARVVAEAGTRDTGSAGLGPEGWLPCCHGSPETSEPRRGQLLTVPGGLWGHGEDHLALIQWWGDLQSLLEERREVRAGCPRGEEDPGEHSLDLTRNYLLPCPSPQTAPGLGKGGRHWAHLTYFLSLFHVLPILDTLKNIGYLSETSLCIG